VGTLYVVATPIGNLEDVTLRALRVLSEADEVLVEDTRRTRVLLERHGVTARTRSLHAHNEARRTEETLARLAEGGDVALVSDAGTPLVSDPGHRLVAAASAAGHRVVPVPGASAALAAVVASGLPEGPFTVLGFLPRKRGARDRLLASYRGRPETLVLFESPRRVADTLRAVARVLGERPACVARELTKVHEQLVRGTPTELAERHAEGVRGEVTVVVAGAGPDETADDTDLDARIGRLRAEGLRNREIVDRLREETGRPRKDLYARVTGSDDHGGERRS
jgi:16S rRNA (cytidine1402-2'-O)-methyltransferase